MKYALIGEDQIQAIEDALSVVDKSFIASSVLDIIRSVKPQEPVAWGVLRTNGVELKILSLNRGAETDLDWIPLYALEQT